MRRPWLAVPCFALLIAPSTARAQIDFDTGRALPATGEGRSLALADVDEDGRLDVLVSGGVGLLAHTVRDPFAFPAPPFAWAVSGTPQLVVAGDLDADGHSDWVVASTLADGTSSLDVGFGDGRGGATMALVAATSGPVSSIALLDADGDSLLDVAAAFEATRDVVLVRQDRFAPRSFLPPALVAIGGSAFRLVTGDFDGDGAADLVAVAQSSRDVVILPGDGAGGFRASRVLTLGVPIRALAADDLNGDGLTDVLAVDSVLFTLLGHPTAGLVPGWTGIPTRPSVALAIGDLDADGIPDAVTSCDPLQAWRGDGTGRFAPASSIERGRNDGALAIGDVDGDGIADVVAARPQAGAVDILLRTPEGEFLRPTLLDGPGTGSGVAGDWNGDGALDLAFTGSSPVDGHGRVHFYFGDGAGGFFPRGEAFWQHVPTRVIATDLVGDGAPDLLLASFDFMAILRNEGGEFALEFDMSVNPFHVGNAVGDFDGDRSIDFATGNTVGWGFHVVFGDGNGGFTSTAFSAQGAQSTIAAGDFDSDGIADLALATTVPSGFAVAFGVPDRTFRLSVVSPAGPSPAGLAVGDADGDGIEDVCVGDREEAVARVFFGDGVSGFLRTLAVATPLPPIALALGDATGDGVTDIVAAHGAARAFSILPGNGRGGFLEATPLFHVPSFASEVFVADVDADGVAEVVVPGNEGPAAVCRPRETALAAALRGTVAAAIAPAQDVLFVNGRSGGISRRVSLRSIDPFWITVARPPFAVGLAPFAMYAWPVAPSPSTVRALPAGLGSIALPMPLAPGEPAPRAIWNNVGRTGALGAPTRPSSPAPTTLFGAPAGAGRAITFTLQGIIVDPGAPNGRAAVTNGVVVEIR